MNRVRIATITCALIGAFLWGCGEQESLTVVQIEYPRHHRRGSPILRPRAERKPAEPPRRPSSAARVPPTPHRLPPHVAGSPSPRFGYHGRSPAPTRAQNSSAFESPSISSANPCNRPSLKRMRSNSASSAKGLHSTLERMTWGIMAKARPELEQAVGRVGRRYSPFGDVAARYSITPDAVNGGELGWLRVESIRRMGLP